jgi:NCS1 family nucleobase:cation symporter-1
MSSGKPVPVLVITGAHPKLYNHDLAPTTPEGRHWGVFSIFAMWMSDVHSVGGYTFAASLFFLGLTGWQVLFSMLIGILLVYGLMNLIGRPSQRYGIPHPVVAHAPAWNHASQRGRLNGSGTDPTISPGGLDLGFVRRNLVQRHN